MSAPVALPVRLGPVSLLVRPRTLGITLALAIGALAALALHIALGGSTIPLPDVLASLLGQADPRTDLAVRGFRLPRATAALVAGAALGMSGAMTQTLARNPLASPDILGVTAGASFGAVAVLVLAEHGGSGGASGATATVAMPLAAIIGGILAGAATTALGWRRSGDITRVVLVGVGISWLGSSLTTWLLTLGDVTNAAIAVTWMTGSLNGREWGALLPALIACTALLVVGASMSDRVALTALDERVGASLGTALARSRLGVLVVALLLAAIATLIAGPIAFVALAAGQIARLATGSPTPPLIASAAVGAAMLLLADIIAANAFPVPLPAGIGTAIVGVPYLIWLLLTARRRAL